MQQSECANFFAAIPEDPEAQVIILGHEARISTARAKVSRSTLSNTDATASVSTLTESTAASYDFDFNDIISDHYSIFAVSDFLPVLFVYKGKVGGT